MLRVLLQVVFEGCAWVGWPLPPVFLGGFWRVFPVAFVFWRDFLGSFGVVLLLFSYYIATVLLEWLVGVVSVCFSGSFRRGEGRNVSDGFFYYPPGS